MSDTKATKEPSAVDVAYQEGYDVARSEVSTELGELVDLLSRGRMRLERSIHKADDATLGAMDALDRAIERVANLVAPGGD
jgi:exonuclease VII small subunit